jgi:3-hydroxyanthranilate 3,4-dioxygenase
MNQVKMPSANYLPPFNFQQWIHEHRDLLVPPVGNKCLFRDGSFIVMVVGGPNSRTDFHVNQSDEFFYQLEGKMQLRLLQKGQFVEVPINPGEVFMLPAGTPHSPQRTAHSIGLVVEKTRTPGEIDALEWYCCRCTSLLYREKFALADIEKQFPPVFERYYAPSTNHSLCQNCGHQNGREWNP